MDNWPNLPPDVVDWFRGVFSEANRAVTERLINVPNIRETSLDDGLIEAIVPLSAPRLLPSGTTVELNVHNIGGLRRLHAWETADIAIIVFVYRAGTLIDQKIGLLQSKRLYPANHDVDDTDPVGFSYGMNAFLRRDPGSVLGQLHRSFEFTDACEYAALKKGDGQQQTIERLNSEFGEAVYYLFYNPPVLPTTVRYPVTARTHVAEFALGCRVYSAGEVAAALAPLAKGQSPTIGALEASTPLTNWRLETWAADLLLTCKVGQRIDDNREALVSRLIERRSGPIGAAIAFSIDLPAGADS
jgi:hypothetical protein